VKVSKFPFKSIFYFLCIFGFLGLFLKSYNAPPSANGLIRKLKTYYSSIPSISLVGSYNETKSDGLIISSSSSKLIFLRPDYYYYESKGSHFSCKIWKSPKGVFYLDSIRPNKIFKKRNLYETQGGFDTSCYNITGLLIRSAICNSIFDFDDYRFLPDEMVSGVTCFHVVGYKRSQEIHVWIDKETSQAYRIQEVSRMVQNGNRATSSKFNWFDPFNFGFVSIVFQTADYDKIILNPTVSSQTFEVSKELLASYPVSLEDIE